MLAFRPVGCFRCESPSIVTNFDRVQTVERNDGIYSCLWDGTRCSAGSTFFYELQGPPPRSPWRKDRGCLPVATSSILSRCGTKRFVSCGAPCRLTVRFARSLQSMASRPKRTFRALAAPCERPSERGVCAVRIPRRTAPATNRRRLAGADKTSRPVVSGGSFRGRGPPSVLR